MANCSSFLFVPRLALGEFSAVLGGEDSGSRGVVSMLSNNFNELVISLPRIVRGTPRTCLSVVHAESAF